MRKKIDIAKLIKRGILLLLLAGMATIFFLDRYAKSVGYKGIKDFYSIYSSNSDLAESAEAVEMNIDMSDSDYEFLSSNRQKALDRGVQINVGDNYVDCEIESGGEKIDAEIRLKGHMTDHLQGDKWSFRVKSKESILGMYRFSLQHPATRNFVYEWVYHQLLKEEGVIALNYEFIHLNLKDKDLGIYAMEEHFGQHVLEHNNRPKGAILRWNPGLYWEWRIDELHGVYLDEQYSAYTSSYAEPYDKGTVRRDSVLVETYKKGASLLEAFRRGDSTASQVFDVQLMARFHAVIDLVGGHHSLDWSDIKFFYNAETGLVEPVGYESFSIRPTTYLAGQRIPNDYHDVQLSYHDQLFADPIFFAAYIENLERIASEEYFNHFTEVISAEFDKKRAIIAKEWPHREFPLNPYFDNIELIQKNLALPKPFHAFLEESSTNETIIISVSPVSDFPVELMEIEIDGSSYPIEAFVLPAKARNSFAEYFELSIPHDGVKLKDMFIKARIPGSKNVFEVEVIEFPSYKSGISDAFSVPNFKTIDNHPDAVFNTVDSVYYFDALDVSIEASYYIQNTTLRLLPGQKINFISGCFILDNSTLEAYGGMDHEIYVQSQSDEVLIRSWESSALFYNTVFEGVNKGFNLKDSKLKMDKCVVADVKSEFFEGVGSDIVINETSMGTINLLGNVDQSTVKLFEVSAQHGESLLKGYGSQVKVLSSQLNDFESLFHLNHLSILDMWSSTLSETGTIGVLNNSSSFNTYNSDMGKAENGFILDREGVNVQGSSFTLYKSDQTGIKTLSK